MGIARHARRLWTSASAGTHGILAPAGAKEHNKERGAALCAENKAKGNARQVHGNMKWRSARQQEGREEKERKARGATAADGKVLQGPSTKGNKCGDCNSQPAAQGPSQRQPAGSGFMPQPDRRPLHGATVADGKARSSSSGRGSSSSSRGNSGAKRSVRGGTSNSQPAAACSPSHRSVATAAGEAARRPPRGPWGLKAACAC